MMVAPWFKTKPKVKKIISPTELMRIQEETLHSLKTASAISFNELTELITGICVDANELRRKLVKIQQKSGLMFIATTGKILFINDTGADITGLNNHDTKVCGFYREDGSKEELASITNRLFEGEVIFASDEVIIIEFENGVQSNPLFLKIYLTDKPKSNDDIAFVCEISQVDHDIDKAEPAIAVALADLG